MMNPLLRFYRLLNSWYTPQFSLSVFILAGTIIAAFPEFSWSETSILEVELAQAIQNREPAHPTKPPAHCEKDLNRGAPLPRIHTGDQQVVFWNRVSSTENTLIRHSWHKKSDEGWRAMAHVDLPIQKSTAFRIWSTKDLHPALHRGEWMIVVTLAEDPRDVLCIARFIVE